MPAKISALSANNGYDVIYPLPWKNETIPLE